MFSVLFEVQPKPEKWEDYLGNAKMLRPELEQIDGFVDGVWKNVRCRCLPHAANFLVIHCRLVPAIHIFFDGNSPVPDTRRGMTS